MELVRMVGRVINWTFPWRPGFVLAPNVLNNAAWPLDTSNIEAAVTPIASLLEVPL